MQILCTFVVVGYQPKLEKRDQNKRTCQEFSDVRFIMILKYIDVYQSSIGMNIGLPKLNLLRQAKRHQNGILLARR